MNERKPIINALLTLLWWTLFAGISLLASLLMYSFGENVGSDGSSFLPVTLLKPNLLCYFSGLLLWIAACVIIWKKLLRPTFDFCRGRHPGWMLLWLLEAAIGLTAQLAASLFGMLLGMRELFARSEPAILDSFVWFTVLFPLLFGAADLLIGHFRGKSSEH
jgi:hypothetical protein